MNSRAEAAAALMVLEGIEALPAEKAVNTIYVALADRLTGDELETLSNRLGQAAHQKSREEGFRHKLALARSGEKDYT